jgi:hypothetical protein
MHADHRASEGSVDMTSPEELAFENVGLKKQVAELRSLSNQQAEKIGGLSAQVTAADRLAKTLERDLVRERHNAEVEIKALKEQVHRLKSDVHGEMMLREAAESTLNRIEHAWCIEGDYAANGPDDKRHPIERRLAGMQAMHSPDVEKLRADLTACRVERDTWLAEHGRVTAELEACKAETCTREYQRRLREYRELREQYEALRAGVDELLQYSERHECLDIARGLRALLKPATPEQSCDDGEGIECPLVDCCESEPCKKPKTVEKLLAQIEPERLTRTSTAKRRRCTQETVTVIDETKANELDAAHKRYELFAGAIYWELDRQLREGADLSRLQHIVREHGVTRVPPSPAEKQCDWSDL